MTLREFSESPNEPKDLTPPLSALWQDAAGNWEAAHHLVQEDESAEAAWVHAYLHRKEGDNANAGYWYARAGKPKFEETLEAEWAEIARALLANG